MAGLLESELSRGITTRPTKLESGFMEEELSPTFFLEGLWKLLDKLSLLKEVPTSSQSFL